MTPKDVQAEILRLFHTEKWRPGSIASALGVHYVTVKRVLEKEGIPPAKIQRRSKLDPFLPFIRQTLERFPKVTAARLYDMACERGYEGKPSQFRAVVATLRPRRPREAFLRLRTAPADQGQVDWGHFGKIKIGNAERPLMAFVLVLSYSRAIFLRFFPGAEMSYFLEGHQQAFNRWQGCPRNLLYDNLKSVVVSRPTSSVVEFNEDFASFAAHYRFRAIPVGIRRGNEKGRVERAIRYVRTNFFAARHFDDLDDLNGQADRWATQNAMERPWPDDRNRTVREAYEEEQPLLLDLRETPFPCAHRHETRVRKTPHVRFDRNDYSVPHQYVGQRVTIHADMKQVKISLEGHLIAQHARSFDSQQTIETIEHSDRLVESKRRASKDRRTTKLFRLVANAEAFLKEAMARGYSAGQVTKELNLLLQSYGGRDVESAIQESLERGVSNVHAVRHVLEKNRLDSGEDPPLPLSLPDDSRLKDLTVIPHSLKNYDKLAEGGEHE